MFCRYCGARVPEDSRFCPACGHQLSGDGEQEGNSRKEKKHTGEQRKTTGDQRQNAQTGGSNRRLRWPVIACAVIVLTLGIRVWNLNRTHDRNTAPRSVEEVLRDQQDPLLENPELQEELKDLDAQVQAALASGQAAPSAQAEPATQAETPSVSAGQAEADLSSPPAGGMVLPDPGLFLNCARLEDQDSTSNGNQDAHIVSYLFSMDSAGKAAVEEYLALLEEPRYQLRLGQQWEDDYTKTSAQLFKIYSYTYTGGKMGLVRDWKDREGNLLISVKYDSGQENILLTLRYKKSFSFEDSGSQAGTLPRDLSGNSGGSSGGVGGDGVTIPEFAKKDCSICDGTGKCTYCGGDGYLHSRASDKEDRNCTHCRNHDGKCTYCDGTGKQKV